MKGRTTFISLSLVVLVTSAQQQQDVKIELEWNGCDARTDFDLHVASSCGCHAWWWNSECGTTNGTFVRMSQDAGGSAGNETADLLKSKLPCAGLGIWVHAYKLSPDADDFPRDNVEVRFTLANGTHLLTVAPHPREDNETLLVPRFWHVANITGPGGRIDVVNEVEVLEYLIYPSTPTGCPETIDCSPASVALPATLFIAALALALILSHEN